MRKSIALKSLLRSPLKTLLTFLLIAAASFALFYRVTDYAVTTRETENAKSLYHAVASLDNEVPDLPVMTAYVDSPDKSAGKCYDTVYEMEDKPWLTEEEMEEFVSLPGVTLADTRYTTAGRVEDYKRMVGEGEFGGFVVFEGTYGGYEEGGSILEDHVCLKFDDVKVLACDGGPEVDESFRMEDAPLGEMPYARSPYTRAFYDNLEKGGRCLVLARNSGFSYDGSSGIVFQPHITGEGSLCVIDGLPDDYLETEAFARQKGWVDAVNYNNDIYDVVYTSDMRAIPRFNEQRYVISKGRCLTIEDTESCVVSADFLDEHGLSIGDSIHIQLGDKLGSTTTILETKDWHIIPDENAMADSWKSVELTIVGAYSKGRGNAVYAPSPNTVYVPSSLLPVDVPKDYEPSPSEFSVFAENANDIEAFHEAVGEFAQEVGLTLDYSDRGWLDVKDSLGMGAFTSMLTTVLYVMGAALALFLAVYLYIGRNKSSYAIMRMLGVPAGAAEVSVVLPFVAVSVLAVPAGGITGLLYAQDTAKGTLMRMADSAPEGYILDASIPTSVVMLCLLSELLFVSLAAYSFLCKMKKTPPLELLQEDARPGRKAGPAAVSTGVLTTESVSVQFDLAKFSASGEWHPKRNYGAVRHVASYIWRHMRRGIGKTAVSLILTFVLAAGIGTFVLARLTYQDAYYELGVKGEASGFTFSSAVELSKSPLVKDFYCQERFNVRIQGTQDNIPMTVTSSFQRDLGDDCPVDYAEGYDISVFEGTGQVCLVGKELAKRLGISLGDEIGLMSDILYFILDKSEVESAYSPEGYKAYKVIGIAQTDDVDVRGNIFVGIRSDLQRLFSMDFGVEHCEFTLADNERLDELDALLEKMRKGSVMYSANPSYSLDTGGLTNIERIRSLLEALFPIAVTAAVLIGLFGPLLVILQSAQEAAFLRILGVTKKRARCMLVFEQIILSIAGVLLVAGGLVLYDPGRFSKGAETFAACFGLYLLGGVCGAAAAAVQVTRHKILELLQVKE